MTVVVIIVQRKLKRICLIKEVSRFEINAAFQMQTTICLRIV